MAIRGDRNLFAWQAYVITMSFFSVALLLGMFFLWRAYADLKKQHDDMTGQLQTARSDYTVSNGRVRRLKSMMGFGEFTADEITSMTEAMKNDEELKDVEAEFAKQMKLYAKNDKRSGDLLKLPEYLMDTIRIRNEEIDRMKKQVEQLQADQTATIARETTAREDAETAMKKAVQDLDSERANHQKQLTTINEEKDQITQRFNDNKALFDKEQARLNGLVASLNGQNKKQADTILAQQEEIKRFREDDFAAPQGEILRVANGGQEVWLNIGSEDGLVDGVPFSVIAADTVKVSKAKPKARLQIVEVIDAHMSRAKTTEYDIRKPLLPGDQVYSPAWRSGRKVGFALVGMMDVNSDYIDDSNSVTDLIKLSGGRIDAVLDRELRQTGELGVGTSFLVLGSDTAVSDSSSDEQKNRAAKYATFIKEAKGYGATQMSLDNLMGYLKSQNSDAVIPLGNRTQGTDFRIQPMKNPPVSGGKVSEIFQQRKPQ